MDRSVTAVQWFWAWWARWFKYVYREEAKVSEWIDIGGEG